MGFFGAGKVGRNKYGAKPSNGFPSKLESAVNDLLRIRENEKEITDIQRQQTVILQDGAPNVKISWKLDFSYERVSDGKRCYVEAKGFATEDFKLKLKLWRKNPPAPLEIYKGDYRRPILSETIE